MWADASVTWETAPQIRPAQVSALPASLSAEGSEASERGD